MAIPQGVTLDAARDDMDSAGAPAPRALFLISPAAHPCGVESFARRLSNAWAGEGLEQRNLAVSGRFSDMRAIWSALADADVVVMNFPVVAWKKALLTPLVACLLSLARGKRAILVFHEWADLDWRRRELCYLYSLFAAHIMFSSPQVRAQFCQTARRRGQNPSSSIVSIPANFDSLRKAEDSAFARRLRAEKAKGAIILGYFGAIYPKKNVDFVLDVAAAIAAGGHPVFAIFVGSFIKGADRVEEEFVEKAGRLGVADRMLVTGYIESETVIAGVFREIDCFVYRFAEGLTSRRGSVLACAGAGKTVIVNAPGNESEFAHHRLYLAALASGGLVLAPVDASADQYAAMALAAADRADPEPIPESEQSECWVDTAKALRAACGEIRDDQALLRSSGLLRHGSE